VLNLTVNEYQPFSGINTDRNPYLLLDRSIIEKIYLHSGESILYITVKKPFCDENITIFCDNNLIKTRLTYRAFSLEICLFMQKRTNPLRGNLTILDAS